MEGKMSPEEAFNQLIIAINEVIDNFKQEFSLQIKTNDFFNSDETLKKIKNTVSILEEVQLLNSKWNEEIQNEVLSSLNIPIKNSDQVKTRVYESAEDFEIPFLQALNEIRDEVQISEIMQKIKEILETAGNMLVEGQISRGKDRWRSQAENARNNLKDKNLISQGQHRDTWIITELGIEELKKLNNNDF